MPTVRSHELCVSRCGFFWGGNASYNPLAFLLLWLTIPGDRQQLLSPDTPKYKQEQGSGKDPTAQRKGQGEYKRLAAGIPIP